MNHLRPGAPVAAGGGKWAAPWMMAVNMQARVLHAPYVRSFEGFDRPWNHLEQLIDDVQVRELAFGSGYVLTGRRGRPRRPGSRAVTGRGRIAGRQVRPDPRHNPDENARPSTRIGCRSAVSAMRVAVHRSPVMRGSSQPGALSPRRTERRFALGLRLRSVTSFGRDLPLGGHGRQAEEIPQSWRITGRRPRRRRPRCRSRAGPGCRGLGHTGSWSADPRATPPLARPAAAPRHPARR